VPPGASDLPGLEVAGEIVSGDAAALAEAGFKVGDRVCALIAGGGYAELCVAPVAQCLPVPKGWSDIEAASLPETFFTVWSNVFERGRLQKGETLLIQGGSSGIGVTAIQMAKALGGRNGDRYGRQRRQVRSLQEAGRRPCHQLPHERFRRRGEELTGGKGVDVILDMVAGDYVAREIECLAEDGRLVIIAVQGGVKSEIQRGPGAAQALTITGSTLRPRPVAFKAPLPRRCARRCGRCSKAARSSP
jgi:NADPH2:quinone reductase